MPSTPRMQVRLRIDCPRYAVTASARISGGNANSTSMLPTTSCSKRPRKYPASIPSAPPIVMPMTGAQTPTVSEMRAPKISRASSSRPRPSVPSQCMADAGARRSSMSMSVGLGSGNTLANAAAAKTKIIQTIAAQNSGPSRRLRATGPATTSSSMVSSSVAMTDPGIENGIEHVDNEVHQHEAAGDEQHHALQDDEVAGIDRADKKPADPGQREDRFHDQGAAHPAAALDTG